MQSQAVKIETLQIRNFKRVRVAEVAFTPDGLTVIGGENAQGKSSFLDAVAHLLGGKKYQPSNLHNTNAGGATAIVRAKLSNGIEVERSGKGASLKVQVDGEKGNQGTLNAFLNEFALDISKFMRATDKDKAAMLLKHMGLTDQLEQIENKVSKLEGERTIVGRDAARKKATAEGLPTYDQAPEARVDVSELLRRERELSAENRAHEERGRRLGDLRTAGIAKQERIAELKRQLEAEEAELKSLKTQYMEVNADHETFTPHDLSAIERQLQNSESLNMMFEANATAAKAKKEADAVAKEYQDLTDSITEAREQRTKLIESITMPLPGLQIEDGALLYHGNRWDCMSGSERLRVATVISRAFKPECGFVLVDELEQLDWKTLKEFDTWARSEGIQIIGAMVCDTDKGGENVIIIEDGRVKE
jgi:DNA repair ATPase RecN